MIISVGDKSYTCFAEHNGIKFSSNSSKSLLLEPNRRFNSFDECKQIVALHHNIAVSKIETHCGVQRT